jgi:bifunctional DNA-binding transcriptional regulator/antitoxin component of YhaV-PrlF toxin-antitoxin module
VLKPYGPVKISSQGQVKLPARIMRSLGLNAGDEFFWVEDDEDVDSVLLVSANVLGSRLTRGTSAERKDLHELRSMTTSDFNQPKKGDKQT